MPGRKSQPAAIRMHRARNQALSFSGH
eukprot:COSAG02_NODE_28698_length_584_cov_1.068041_1_plen_26_part_10